MCDYKECANNNKEIDYNKIEEMIGEVLAINLRNHTKRKIMTKIIERIANYTIKEGVDKVFGAKIAEDYVQKIQEAENTEDVMKIYYEVMIVYSC